MDYIIILFITLGTIFILLAAIGILKMPDFYMRMSVSTKAVTLGVGLILIATAIYFNNFSVTTRVAAIIVFLFLTAPVAGHRIGRAAYILNVKLWKDSVHDDLKDKYQDDGNYLKSEHEAGESTKK